MKYLLKCGLEMHCEVKSFSKVFAPSLNAYSNSSNVNVSEVELAFPGVLPSLNLDIVKKSIMAALILNCKLPKYMIFDRKNYYYPDLPKGYQITQNENPVGTKGYIDVKSGRIYISDIHLEEDTASLDHLDTMSLIDYNRCGVPLLECVTEPCITSSDMAVEFVEKMCRIYQYASISDADTKKGQIRCDVNVSLTDENGNSLTPKVEMKNVSSVTNIKKAIECEYKRQVNALENGITLSQETRRYDEESDTTILMRSKADALDYKYFTESNIPPFEITNELIEEVRNRIPVFADERKNKYLNEYNLDEEAANNIVRNIDLANYYEECVNLGINPKIAANYLNGLIISYLYSNEISINDFYLKPALLKEIIDYQDKGIISSKEAKEVFYKSLENNKKPSCYIDINDAQVSDVEKLSEIIENILNRSTTQINDYHNGKTNLFDYFVGQVMKETRGKANPVITKELLHKKLDN